MYQILHFDTQNCSTGNKLNTCGLFFKGNGVPTDMLEQKWNNFIFIGTIRDPLRRIFSSFHYETPCEDGSQTSCDYMHQPPCQLNSSKTIPILFVFFLICSNCIDYCKNCLQRAYKKKKKDSFIWVLIFW